MRVCAAGEVILLWEDEDGKTHFLLIKIWDSIEIMKHFTGGDSRNVKYHPKVVIYLLEKNT